MNTYYAQGSVMTVPATSRSHPSSSGIVLSARLPTDPLFFASITMENIAIGSRYWITQANDHSAVIADGLAVDGTVTLEGIPAFSNPMLIEIRVRQGTDLPKYQPFKTFANLYVSGAYVWVAQIPDTVLNNA